MTSAVDPPRSPSGPDVAIVGVACRFPGAPTYRDFWENLVAGRSSIGEIPRSRWDVLRFYSPDRDAKGKSISKWCGLVDGIDRFDHRFFEVSPREAKQMDPQQRLLLEETAHCIEDSGVPLRELQARRTSVFAGVMGIDHQHEILDPSVTTDAFAGTGSFVCILANRISYAFGLSGKSFTIDAACASSLVALHEAKASLAKGESDFAVVAGVSVNTHPWKYVAWSKARMLSPDGRCKTFDVGADGYVPGDGVGVLLLQRRDEAERAKNRIYGVVRGSAVGHGGRGRALSAPRVEAQEDVVRRALGDGGVDARSIGYVEAHGTGTSLGDPIEVEALTRAYRADTEDAQFAKIGSVKSNIGHLEAAAGVAGVVKVLLMMRHGVVPKTLHVRRPNPIIDFASSPFALAVDASEWPAPAVGPRRAGVSSFGIGGVNSHVVIEEHRGEDAPREPPAPGRRYPFLLSAKSEASLRRKVAQWRAFDVGAARIDDLCKTLAVSSADYAHRWGAIVETPRDVEAFLARDVELGAEPPAEALVVRDFQIAGFADVERLYASCAPFRARLDALVRDAGGETGLGDELRRASWSSERAPALSSLVGCAVLASLVDAGYAPRRHAGEGRGLVVALAGAGVLGARDVAALASPRRDAGADAVAWRAPSTAFFDPIGGAFVRPLAIDEDALRALVADLRLDAEELRACVESASLLLQTQYTFKQFIEEWADVLAPFGGVERMLEDAASYAADDRRRHAIFCAVTDASDRLNDKWSLRRRPSVRDPRLLDLVDLVGARVLTREHVAELLLGDPACAARIAREATVPDAVDDARARRLSSRFPPRMGDAAWLRAASSSDLCPLADAAAIDCALSGAGAGDLCDRFDALLVALWRRGAPLTWDALYPSGTYAKIALPPYPFERESFWVHDREDDAVPSRTSVSVADALVRDHVIGGRHLVPAALFVELARGAASASQGRDVTHLRDVVLEAPGVVHDTVAVDVSVDGADVRVAVAGVASARARIGAPSPRPADDRASPARVARLLDVAHLYRELARTGYAYGPSLRRIASFSGDGEIAIAGIDAGAGAGEATLDPAVVDAVLQAGLLAAFVRGALTFGDDVFVPSYLGSVEVHAPLRGALRARITIARRAGATLTVGARVDDESGRCVLELREIVYTRAASPPASRAAPPSVAAAAGFWIRAPRWTCRELAAAAPAARGDAVVVASADPLSDAIVAAAARAHRSVRVIGADEAASLGDAARPQDGVECIYFAPALDACRPVTRDDAFDDGPLRAFFEMVKALSRAARPVTVVAPVRRAFAAAAVDRVEGFGGAAFAGLAKTAALECASLRFRVVDVDGESAAAARAVVLEATSGGDDLVAYRGGERLVRELVEASLARPSGAPLFRDGKNVVVVGGLGGVGRHVVDELASRARCRVIVLGRAAASDARVASFLAAPRGCAVHYASCDVTDRASLRAALDDARACFGPLSGVLHLGGVLDDRLLVGKTWDAFRRVLAPKIEGIRNLDACTAGDPLDLFVAFSSVVGWSGNVGQSDYAAANAVLGSFIASRARSGAAGRSLVVDWPLWDGVGMGSGLDASRAAHLMPISATEGIRAFEETWARAELTHAVVEGARSASEAVPVVRERAPAAPPAPAPAALADPAELSAYVKDVLAAKLHTSADRIDERESVFALGLDSLLLQEVMTELGARWSNLSPTLFFEHPNVASLTSYLRAKGAPRPAAAPSATPMSSPKAVAAAIAREPDVPSASPALLADSPSARVDPSSVRSESPSPRSASPVAQSAAPKGYAIAVIGMSGRFPRARTARDFWRNLVAGEDCITEVPEGRWDHRRLWAPRASAEGPTSYGRWGGFIDDVDRFDPLFFHVSPKEAEEMDPQQRLFLECVWETMEDAGYGRRDRYTGKRVGLFVGTMWNDYSRIARDAARERGKYAGPGSIPWAIANRASYVMDFTGPSLVIDTACSSSLVAIHLACQSILTGDSEMAIAGGVNLSIHPDKYVYLSQAKFLSTDGRCRSFGEGGDGYVPGEGVGALLLKPLASALADGDAVYGVIRGSAANHGGKATGFTVPSPGAQADVIGRALDRAEVRASDVSYVECHGTGTSLGDPIETRGLALAFERHTDERQFCPIGSVKSNVGHLEAAAGVAAMIKVLWAMRQRTIPKSLHSETLNANIDFASTPFFVARESQPWTPRAGRPRIAGVSSFGAGGANAHVVLEEHVASDAASTPGPEVLVLSGKDAAALDAGAARLAAFLDDDLSRDVPLGDVAHTLQVGREHWKHRLAIVACDRHELREALALHASGAPRPPRGDAPIDRAAAAWERGERVDWASLAAGRARRVTRLPTYPFKRDRYWISSSDEGVDARAVARDESVDALRGARVVAASDPWLVDHVVGGSATLPGACQIELVLAEGARDGGAHAVIEDLVWFRPVSPTGPVAIDVAFDEAAGAGGRRRFVVTSRTASGDRVDHAQGALVRGAPRVAAPAIDRDAIARRCATHLAGDACYAAFARAGIAYGPSLRAIDRLDVADGEALARLRVRAGAFVAARGVARAVHLDAALQTALSILTCGVGAVAGSYVPFTVRAVSVTGPLDATCFAHARRTGGPGVAPTFDVALANERGDVVATLLGVVLRRVAGSTASVSSVAGASSAESPSSIASASSIETASATHTEAPEERYYASAWVEAARPPASRSRAGGVVVFETDELTGPRVARAMRDVASERVVRVRPGDAFRQLASGTFDVVADDPASYRALLRAIAPAGVDRFVHLWSTPRGGALDERVRRGYLSVLFLVQALIAERAASGAALVHAYAAGASDAADAAVGGLLRTVAREKADLASLSLGLAERGGDRAAVVAAELAALDAGSADVVHDGARRTRRWRPIAAPVAGAPVLDAGDVCLVTGGAGGLGRIVAQHLVERWGARVVLTGRSELDAEQERRVAHGFPPGTVTYLRGDVSRRRDVDLWIRRIEAEIGPLRGVVHSAGVTRDAYLVNKTRAQVDAVLAAKVYGTAHLDEATRGADLRFFVLFSSVSAALGNAGQSDYAYGNAFLDAFSRRREDLRLAGARAGKTVSIDWPLWKDGGMTVDAAAEALLAKTMGIRPMRRDEGLRGFDAALHFEGERIMVVTGDEERFERLLRVENERAPAAPGRGEGAGHRALVARVRAETLGLMSAILKVRAADIDVDEDVREYGFDSITLTNFANAVNERFDLELTPAVFFEYATIAGFVDHLAATYAPALTARLAPIDEAPATPPSHAAGLAPSSDEPAETAPVRAARLVSSADEAPPSAEATKGAPPATLVASDASREKAAAPARANVASDARRAMDVAIVGLAGSMPGSKDLGEFWDHLVSGDDLVTPIPDERVAWWGRAPAATLDAMRGKQGGFVDGPDRFDAAFFGFSPREADFMDPQQRRFLETVWHVVEDAGYRMSELWGTRTALFVGVGTSDYAELLRAEGSPIDAVTATGTFHSILANRVSYLFNFTGPSEPVDTACSSSLVAIQRAVESIRSGACDAAIAGGVNMLLSPTLFLSFERGGMLSPDGRCKTFDKSANGYVRGEGCGAVLLKPLDRALADGDHVYAVVKGAAVGHAGRANSLTAPNPSAQAELLVRAYEQAGVSPERVGLIEAHGTGTSLGDPIEVNALKKAFGELYDRCGAPFDGKKTCALGAVKTNVGHLEAAAGIAGVAKVLLAMKHRRVPKNLHFGEVNPFIDIDRTPFFVPRAARDWPAPGGEPRVAGVSSFGFGGVNAHVVLEEHVAPPPDARDDDAPAVLVLSAKSEGALRRSAQAMLRYIEGPDEISVADVAYTLQVGREAMPVRMAIHAERGRDLIGKLRGYVAKRSDVEGLFTGEVPPRGGATSLVDGEEGRVYLRLLTESRRFAKLCELWTSGVEIDWRPLHEGAARRRVPLPTYPFERERHWHDRHAAAEPREQASATANGSASAAAPPKAPAPSTHGAPPALATDAPASPVHARAPAPPARAEAPASSKAPAAKGSVTNGSGVAKRLLAAEKLAAAQQTNGGRGGAAKPAVAPVAEVRAAAPAAAKGPSEDEIRATLRGLLAEVVFVDAASIDDSRPFVDLGLDSILGVEFVDKINKALSACGSVKDSDLYAKSNVADLAELLASRAAAAGSAHEPVSAR